MSHLQTATPDRANDPRELTVPIPGADFYVALAMAVTRLRSTHLDTVFTALIRGIDKLHNTEEGHDCTSTATDRATTRGTSPPDDVMLEPQEAAVLAQVPLTHQALGMLAPTQIMALSLPRYVDGWIQCIARVWAAPPSDSVTWLLAEGASALHAAEPREDTPWHIGLVRSVIPAGPYQPHRRPIEIPGARRQATDDPRPTRLGQRVRPRRNDHPRRSSRHLNLATRPRMRLRTPPLHAQHVPIPPKTATPLTQNQQLPETPHASEQHSPSSYSGKNRTAAGFNPSLPTAPTNQSNTPTTANNSGTSTTQR